MSKGLPYLSHMLMDALPLTHVKDKERQTAHNDGSQVFPVGRQFVPLHLVLQPTQPSSNMDSQSAGTHHGQSVSWYTSWTASQLVHIMDSQSAGTHHGQSVSRYTS